MLVLSRKRLETLLIGSGIRVHILSVGPKRVVLGIEAPDDVRVSRVTAEPLLQAAPATAPAAD